MYEDMTGFSLVAGKKSIDVDEKRSWKDYFIGHPYIGKFPYVIFKNDK